MSMSMSFSDPINGTTSKMNSTVESLYAALGKEWRFGIKGNWGLALELGAQVGNGEFSGSISGQKMSIPYDPGTLYFGGNGAYYF